MELLPTELHDQIFEFLSPVELVRTARVSRLFHSLAYRTSSWQRSYEKRFGSCQLSVLSIVTELKNRVYPRFDGVYFAKCQYYRTINQGQSLTDSRTYLSVVYFRLFRFWADGSGLMATQPAEVHQGEPKIPKRLLRQVTPPTHTPPLAGVSSDNVHVGSWRFDEVSNILIFEYLDKGDLWIAEFNLFHTAKRISAKLGWTSYHYRRTEGRGEAPGLPDVELRLVAEHFPDLSFKQIKSLVYLF